MNGTSGKFRDLVRSVISVGPVFYRFPVLQILKGRPFKGQIFKGQIFKKQ